MTDMALADAHASPVRHPWLAALVAAPEAEMRALVGGYADIPPFGRAEPADAAASLLFGLVEGDPARQAFDAGCRALLESLRAAMLQAESGLFKRLAAMMDRLLAVIRRTRPRDTVADLHQRYAYWFGIMEAGVIDQDLDLRREYLRLLALTQNMAGEGLEPRRLMPLWLEICAEAGAAGRYDESYLDVGLIGLRQLPLGADFDSNEEAVCQGLARWAVRQRPTKLDFLDRWREIESAYPRSPTYWPPLVADVIAAVEEELRSDSERASPSFPAAAWWREELELPVPDRGRTAPPSGRKRPIEPPPREAHERILQNINSPASALRPQIDRLMNLHRRYADATGDVFYFVRTACNLGMRLIQRNPGEQVARGSVAAALAREALEYEPANAFAWSLRRDALAARHAFAAAEEIGWESIRRFPEDEQWRTQLATLLSDYLHRSTEAEKLLRETIAFFPQNPVARTQLATVLADHLDRPDEAVSVLRETIRIFPDNPHSYGQLAILLVERFDDRDGARRVLQEKLRRMPDDRFGMDLLERLNIGRRLRARPPARPSAAPLPDRSAEIGAEDFPTARARRALFLVETSAGSEREAALASIARILSDDPGLAYMRYAAERAGVMTAGGFGDTIFAFAFDRAAREGSAAALRALISHQTSSIGSYIARAGITLLTQAAEFDIPPAANDLDSAALPRRFAQLVTGLPSVDRRRDADPRPYLRLLSDFAASGLSDRIAA